MDVKRYWILSTLPTEADDITRELGTEVVKAIDHDDAIAQLKNEIAHERNNFLTCLAVVQAVAYKPHERNTGLGLPLARVHMMACAALERVGIEREPKPMPPPMVPAPRSVEDLNLPEPGGTSITNLTGSYTREKVHE